MKSKTTSAQSSAKAPTGIEEFDEVTNRELPGSRTAFVEGQRSIFKFRLYVAGGTQNSALALANLTALCDDYLRDRHEIEIVDVLRDPKRALADSIFLTPTLVRLTPSPVLKIVGTLGQLQPVLKALGLSELIA